MPVLTVLPAHAPEPEAAAVARRDAAQLAPRAERDVPVSQERRGARLRPGAALRVAVAAPWEAD